MVAAGKVIFQSLFIGYFDPIFALEHLDVILEHSGSTAQAGEAMV
jgi:hypothetical protein